MSHKENRDRQTRSAEEYTKLYLVFLQDLHKKLKDGQPVRMNMTAFMTGYSIPRTDTMKAIVELGIVNKMGTTGAHITWTWANLNVLPSEELAEKLYKKITAEKEAMPTKKHKPKKGANKNSPSILSEAERIKNIKEFLQTIYGVMKGAKHPISSHSIRLTEVAQKFHIFPSPLDALKNCGVFLIEGKNRGLKYQWIGGTPTLKMAEEVLSELKKSKSKKNKKSKGGGSENRQHTNASSKNIPSLDKIKALAKKWIELGEYDEALETLNQIK